MSQLHRPLHAAGYYLSKQLRYEDSFPNIEEVRSGLQECMQRMLSEEDYPDADVQLESYDLALGEFGCRDSDPESVSEDEQLTSNR